MQDGISLDERASEVAGSGIRIYDQVKNWIENDSVEALFYVGAAFGLYFLFVLVRAGLRKLAGDPETHGVYSWRGIVARVLQKTRSFFLFAAAAELVTISVEAPPAFQRIIAFFFTVALVIQGAIWLREFILAVIGRRAAEPHEEDSTLVNAMGIIRILVSVGVWALALILILDNLGIDVTALVAGLGIGGIAIGLAAQGIFSDLFAALSILFDKPFKRGDTINFGEITGTVEAIGLKTTRVRALSGDQVVISNTKLLDDKIRNYALFQRRRVVLPFGVIYQTPPALLDRLQEEVKTIVEDTQGATFDRVHVWQFGSSSIDFELVFFSESADYTEMMQRRHDIMTKMVARFDEIGVDFAYPTQMGFLAGPDGKALDPREVPERARIE